MIDDGIVAIGGNLQPERLIAAYRQGIFPWPIGEGIPLAWFCPPERAILEHSNIHIPRSLAKAKKRVPFQFSINQCFREVIEACAQSPRPGQDGTWITTEIIDGYCELHKLGYAHSIETWHKGRLIGGVYGVAVDGVFAGESMFYREPNASKLAILYLMEHLKQRGLDWIDIQMMTPHMEALGARKIRRESFLKKLHESQDPYRKLF